MWSAGNVLRLHLGYELTMDRRRRRRRRSWGPNGRANKHGSKQRTNIHQSFLVVSTLFRSAGSSEIARDQTSPILNLMIYTDIHATPERPELHLFIRIKSSTPHMQDKQVKQGVSDDSAQPCQLAQHADMHVNHPSASTEKELISSLISAGKHVPQIETSWHILTGRLHGLFPANSCTTLSRTQPRSPSIPDGNPEYVLD
ncbi:hypothetical protein B0T10DRAFT_165194 [Thelonectria olida]|uniref:Uncharacterized protein n=1 Tax=Thelonectria olida TaxID=1576542 RepID=A0A9P8WH60_9HYPO|nr:hypothetical protein B0T10DRAFT_165194 [Thelonectria olida]